MDRGHFDLKTPKSGQKKYLKCPKQVGMDSQDIPGVVLCPSSCHDVEILQFFLKIWSKMVVCPKMAQMADLCFRPWRGRLGLVALYEKRTHFCHTIHIFLVPPIFCAIFRVFLHFFYSVTSLYFLHFFDQNLAKLSET